MDIYYGFSTTEVAPYVHASISGPAQLGRGDLMATERENRDR